MKRSMISAAFAIGLLASAGAEARTSVSQSQYETIAVALEKTLRTLDQKSSLIGLQSTDSNRSLYNSNQNKISFTASTLSSEFSSTQTYDPSGISVSHLIVVTSVNAKSFVLKVTTFGPQLEIVEVATLTVDLNGRILSLSTDAQNSAGSSHSQNSSSGGASRGDSASSSSSENM